MSQISSQSGFTVKTIFDAERETNQKMFLISKSPLKIQILSNIIIGFCGEFNECYCYFPMVKIYSTFKR